MTLAGGLVYLGFASQEGQKSHIARLPNLDATPGGERQRESAQYQDTLRAANDLNLERARSEGNSFVLVPEAIPRLVETPDLATGGRPGDQVQGRRHSADSLERAAGVGSEAAASPTVNANSVMRSASEGKSAHDAEFTATTLLPTGSNVGTLVESPGEFSPDEIAKMAVPSSGTTAGTRALRTGEATPFEPSTSWDEADVAALRQAMLAQMNAIAAGLAIGPAASRVLISDAASVHQESSGILGDRQSAMILENGAEQASSVVDIVAAPSPIIPAGAILYGEAMNEVNSDHPTPVLVEVTTGPWKEWRLVGKFSVAEDHSGLIVEFDSLVRPTGQTTPVEALAIDGITGRSMVASTIDRRLLARYGPVLAASFIRGLAESAAQPRTSIASVGNSPVFVTDQPSHRQSLYSGLAAASNLLAGDLTSSRPKGPRVTLSAGHPLGILFTSSAALQ
ncbi:MAG: DotG/IcmE/VirB10 family protein [Rhodobacteraceae bacterium]|nr:DotG/IcmE/VirB10 family protein [Paracoccaceae bacterium]